MVIKTPEIKILGARFRYNEDNFPHVLERLNKRSLDWNMVILSKKKMIYTCVYVLLHLKVFLLLQNCI